MPLIVRQQVLRRDGTSDFELIDQDISDKHLFRLLCPLPYRKVANELCVIHRSDAKGWRQGTARLACARSFRATKRISARNPIQIRRPGQCQRLKG